MLAEPTTIKQMPTIQAMVAERLGVSLAPKLAIARVPGCRAVSLLPRRFRRIAMLRPAGGASFPALDAWQSVVRRRLRRLRGRLQSPNNRRARV